MNRADGWALLLGALAVGLMATVLFAVATDDAHASFRPEPTGQHRHPAVETMPHCANEDGSGGPRPCTWNVGPGPDGNGYGRPLWVDARGGVHYLRVLRGIARPRMHENLWGLTS